MSLPVEFIGAWRRVGLVIDGVRRVDYCDVLWLQSPDWFVDIRTHLQPGVGPSADDPHSAFAAEFAFAGTTEFIDPRLRWNHMLDSREAAPPDENPVAWQDDLLIETGAFEWQGRLVPFIEEWGHLGSSEVSGVGRDDYVRVEAAGLAIEASVDTGGFRAVKHRHRDGAWVETARLCPT